MGYKAFNKGMICNGKQYAEHTDYEEQGADRCCKAGVMHYCDEPFDVWDYYPIIDKDGNFTEYAEVEPRDEVLTECNKRATKKLHIGAKLSFRNFVEAAINVVIEKTKIDAAQIGSSGRYAKIGSSGYAAQIGSSGRYAQIGSSGRYAQIGSSGDDAKIGSSGDAAQIGSSGYAAQIGSSGRYAQIGSSGRYAQIGSSGYAAQIGSSGRYAQIGSSGDDARIVCEAEHAVVACAGKRARIKAPIGTWITLSEYGDYDGMGYPCICVKSAQIDGEILKPDVFYMLKNGEFVECDDDD